MTQIATLMTAEQLFYMPNDNLRHELVAGRLATMPWTGFEHGVIGSRMGSLLIDKVRTQKHGCVSGAQTGFILSRNPDTVRCADVAFVCRERIQATGVPKQFFPGPPDLAVGVVSPGDTVNEVDEKVECWLAHGTKQVWVVSPKWRTVTVHRGGGDIQLLKGDETVAAGDLIPAFSCQVNEIFADLPPIA